MDIISTVDQKWQARALTPRATAYRSPTYEHSNSDVSSYGSSWDILVGSNVQMNGLIVTPLPSRTGDTVYRIHSIQNMKLHITPRSETNPNGAQAGDHRTDDLLTTPYAANATVRA
ncbi:hypothetical protein N7539_004470 [Penicillium diatomitis]|uniref:Uncharacterized protein n=1 Tax=Penicillium diatomitis TaxID=2819901 RepID=A0A9X0BYA2_9EURO|nr:uncharacterized protein N7539_004470 [Penicillium diatomitis]KAJ5489580.1 hypothetical protein N7539_004470 [Penicillium diatomitis]